MYKMINATEDIARDMAKTKNLYYVFNCFDGGFIIGKLDELKALFPTLSADNFKN